MTVFALRVGLVVRRGERTFALARELEDHTLVFEDRLTARPMSLSRHELWQKIQSGDIAIVTGQPASATSAASGSGPVSGSTPSGAITSWTAFPDKYRLGAELRMKYVLAARRAGLTRGQRRGLAAVIAKVASALTTERKARLEAGEPVEQEASRVPSESTLLRWMRLYDEADCTPMGLIDGKALAQRAKRKCEKVLAICRQVLRTHYCTRKRPTLAQSLIVAQAEVNKEVQAERIKAEDARICVSTFRRLKCEIEPYQLDHARYGAAYARNRWRYSLQGQHTDRALQRYEVDHTILDLVVICDRTGMPLGRPTLTVVIDTYSGYVVGFFISFWGTGLAATFSALKVAIKPKPDYSAQLKGLKNPWHGMGLPELLVMDNGLEFHSPQFQTMAMQLALNLQYCPARQPWMKPFVERSLGTVLNYLPPAGRVLKALTNELPLNPAETAAVTFSDLVFGLLVSFCDIHAFEINERKVARPHDLFLESLERLPPPSLPVDTQELEIIVAPSRQLTIGNEGVVSQYLRFNSPELQQLRRRTGHTFKTTVKFHPETLDHVWVHDPANRAWIVAPSCQPEYTQGLSMIQHRAIRAMRKEGLNRRNAEDVLLQAKIELMQRWNSRAVIGKRLQNKHLQAMAGLTSNFVLGIPEVEIATPSPKLLCAPELAAPEREIPVFTSFNMH